MALSESYLALVNDAKTRIAEIDVAGYRQLVDSGVPFVPG